MAQSPETRQFAVEQVDKLLGQLASQISRTLKPHDPISVHHLRVAVRRFSRALLVFGPCFRAQDVKKIRRRLEEIMIPARELRDCDLAIHRLSTSKQAEAAELLAELGRQRKDAEHMLLGMLRRWMERKSSLKWRTKLQSAFAGTKKTLPDTAQEAAAELLPDLAQEFFVRGSQAADAGCSAGELHQFRVAAKKLRYTLELFTTLYSPALGAWIERIRSIQGLAGAIDDCASVRRMLGGSPGAEAVEITLGKKQRKQIEEFLHTWKERFASPDHAREWIHYLRYFDENRQIARKPMARSISALSLPGRSFRPA
jgi:CHAD domain-containing protein